MSGMDLKHFVVTDEIDDTGESSSVAAAEQQTRRSTRKLSKNEPRTLCTHCNIKVASSKWDAHILTKDHLKKAGLLNREAYDERDLYVDESTNVYKTIMGSKRPLAGAEHVVTEKSSEETLCVLCMAQLKDPLTIVDHLRSQKHINSFIMKHFPEIYRTIQSKSQSKEETQHLLVKRSDDLVRKFGKKEPFVHEKGLYKKLSASKQKAVDERLKAREREVNEQKSTKMSDIVGLKRSDRSSSSRDKSEKRGEKRRISRSPRSQRRRRSRSGSDSRSPWRSRSRSPHTSRSGSRSLKTSRDQGYEHFHHDYQLLPPSQSPHQWTPNWRSPPPASYAASSRGWEEEEGPAFAPSPRHDEERSSNRGEPSIDDLEELPTEPDLFEILCDCPFVDLTEGDRAYIQDILDSMPNEMLIGVYFVAEYVDPRGAYEPGYLCSLCQCRMNPSQAVRHIVSERHTMHFLERFYNKQFTALCMGNLNDEARSQMRRRYLSEIGQQEHETSITQRINLRPEQRLVFRHHKRVAPPASIPRSFDGSKDGTDSAHLKPSTHSSGTQEAQGIEKELPPYCEKNLKEGWYSIRRKSADYYRRFTGPDALYYSVRNPAAVLTDFYGDWNPMLMRRLQDKFNFKLDHIKWLQRLLTQWQIPVYSPLQMADLRPLEQEVEAAVLNELLDQLLKPVAPLRHMQVFQYETYPEKQQQKSSNVNEKTTSGMRAVLRKPLEVVPKSGKDRKLLAMIDQVLAEARSQQQHSNPNPVRQLLTRLEDARAILFALAVKQPTQLNQLIGLAKETLVSIPPDKLEALRKLLSDVAEDARHEQEKAERAAAKAKEALLRQRRDRVEQTRMELLSAVQREQDNSAAAVVPPLNLQSFPPNVPAQMGFGFSR